MYMFAYYAFVLEVTLLTLQTDCVVQGGRICTDFLNSDDLCILACSSTRYITSILLLESKDHCPHTDH